MSLLAKLAALASEQEQGTNSIADTTEPTPTLRNPNADRQTARLEQESKRRAALPEAERCREDEHAATVQRFAAEDAQATSSRRERAHARFHSDNDNSHPSVYQVPSFVL